LVSEGGDAVCVALAEGAAVVRGVDAWVEVLLVLELLVRLGLVLVLVLVRVLVLGMQD
jgi:hypothetical protein